MNPIFSVSDAVAFINQTLDFAYPSITIVGEISSFSVSKNKWLYFDVKDEDSKLKCFGTVFQLKLPLEDGMQVEITARPRLHNQFGFSLNILSVRPIGEGSIKKASSILQAMLEKEGLFDPQRKRLIPKILQRVALIASDESAAYADFTKILDARWQGVEVVLFNTQVQGEAAPDMITESITKVNQYKDVIDVIVIIRGGGSADDLSVFSTEKVVRAVASSRVPVCAAIGHETDTSLVELAADLRASTPSNAAELLFPDKQEAKSYLALQRKMLLDGVKAYVDTKSAELTEHAIKFQHATAQILAEKQSHIEYSRSLLESVHPKNTLKRGFALVELDGKLVSGIAQISQGSELKVTLKDGSAKTIVAEVNKE